MAQKTENKLIRVETTAGEITFIGHYRRDIERAIWHYYETEIGDLLHFRKEHMIAVLEGESADRGLEN